MIPTCNITYEEFSKNKYLHIEQQVRNPSYTELWLDSENKRIIKLFSRDESIRQRFMSDIKNDILVLLELSNVSQMFEGRFVLPDLIYKEQSEIIGYSMPFIQGNVLSQQKNLSVSDFKKIVFQIYEDIKSVYKTTGFLFADLHEDNVILGNDGKIYHIDLDGWYCGNGQARRSRYVAYQSKKLQNYSKYKIDDFGNVIPTLNSDMFCLMHIILNYLLQEDFYFADMLDDEQEEYLDYLAKYCGAQEIVNSYRGFFSNQVNEFDINMILSLPEDISSFSYKEYKNKTLVFKNEIDAENFLKQNEQRLRNIIPQRIRLFDND